MMSAQWRRHWRVAKLNSPEGEEKSKGMEIGTHSIRLVTWKKRNRSAFEWVQQVFVKLQIVSNFLLVYL